MNAHHALAGAFHGLRASRGQQSGVSHALLFGLEALTQEVVWSTPYCGGSSEVAFNAECGMTPLAWTVVEWKRGSSHG